MPVRLRQTPTFPCQKHIMYIASLLCIYHWCQDSKTWHLFYIFNFFIAFNVFQSNEICELVYLKIFRFQFRYDLNFLNLFNFSLCHFCFPFGLLDPKNRFGDLYSNVTQWISSFFTIFCNTRLRNCTMLCHSRFVNLV